MVRAFIAVDVGTSGLAQKVLTIQEVLQRAGVKFTAVDPSQAHITLKFLGEVPDLLVERVIGRLDGISFRKFRIVLSGVGFFPSSRRPRVVYIGVTEGSEDLCKLAVLVEREMRGLGFRPEPRKFKPHMTVARIKRGGGVPIERLLEIGREIREEREIRELKLKRSVLTPKGPVYSDLFVKPLL